MNAISFKTGVLVLGGALLGTALTFALSKPLVLPATEPDPHRVYAPVVARDGFPPTATPAPIPTPTPLPDYGDPVALTLASAGLSGTHIIERRHTRSVGGRDFFDDPSHPSRIAWYYRFATIGRGGHNTIFAAHVNYVSYGAGPFVNLRYARVGDTLTVRTSDGTNLLYTVNSVQVIKVSALDMDRVVYPGLASNRERITLISCGGTFIPRAGGGGDYDSRVILVAERILP